MGTSRLSEAVALFVLLVMAASCGATGLARGFASQDDGAVRARLVVREAVDASADGIARVVEAVREQEREQGDGVGLGALLAAIAGVVGTTIYGQSRLYRLGNGFKAAGGSPPERARAPPDG